MTLSREGNGREELLKTQSGARGSATAEEPPREPDVHSARPTRLPVSSLRLVLFASFYEAGKCGSLEVCCKCLLLQFNRELGLQMTSSACNNLGYLPTAKQTTCFNGKGLNAVWQSLLIENVSLIFSVFNR